MLTSRFRNSLRTLLFTPSTRMIQKGYLDATKLPWPYKQMWVVLEQPFWNHSHWWQRRGVGVIYATVLLFKYDFDGCEFLEVRKEISVCLSVYHGMWVCIKIETSFGHWFSCYLNAAEYCWRYSRPWRSSCMENQNSSLPCSHEPVTDSCPDTHVSCPHPVTLLLWDPF
jgi:hypothetical protein